MNVLVLGPESRNRDIIDFLKAQGQNVSVTAESITIDRLRKEKIDFLVSFGYAPILKPPITVEYRRRIINIHNAYLPQGRGIYPIFWTFLEGRPKGISIHFIDEGIDHGEIIARRVVAISEGETLRTFHERLDREVKRLFFEVWPGIVANDFRAIPQEDLGEVPHYRNRVESERLIDLLPKRWDTSVDEVEDLGADLLLSAGFWARYEAEIQ